MNPSKAVFIPPANGLWSLRKATRAALLNNALPLSYTIAEEQGMDENTLHELLKDAGRLRTLMVRADGAVGTERGALRCVAIRVQNTQTGILLHWEGTGLLCAYLPAMDRADAEREFAASLALRELAKAGFESIPLSPAMAASTGHHTLDALLFTLAKELSDDAPLGEDF